MKINKTIAFMFLALLAAGCSKEENGESRLKVFAENMTNASGSKLQIDADNPANSSQWLNNENINVNGSVKTISGDNTNGYSVDVNGVSLSGDSFNGYYAVYPGDDFNGNDVTVSNSNTTASITLNKLVLNFHAGATTHDVVFPMGGKVNEASASEGLIFKHLTAGFRLTLNATTGVTLTNLRVIVYGSAAAAPVTDAVEGVTYTVKWADQAPTVPGGGVGDLTDQEVAFASVMDFDLKTDGSAGLTIAGGGTRQLCIPVTLATVKRITVIGYDGVNQVFAKTSAMSTPPALERNKIYPVKDIAIN